MLESSTFESAGRAKSRKPTTVLVSAVLHVVVVALLVLNPLVRPEIFPVIAVAEGLPLPAIADPLKRDVEPVPGPAIQPVIQTSPDDLIEPAYIPIDIARVVDAPETSVAALTPNSTRRISDVIRTIITRGEDNTPPPPPPPELPSMPRGLMAPLRVGSIEPANLIHQVKPEYPPLARQVRAQGVVILEATITREGTVRDVRVIAGHPLLTKPAQEAVEQWRYKPFIMNGEAIEVITTITINFTLQ